MIDYSSKVWDALVAFLKVLKDKRPSPSQDDKLNKRFDAAYHEAVNDYKISDINIQLLADTLKYLGKSDTSIEVMEYARELGGECYTSKEAKKWVDKAEKMLPKKKKVEELRRKKDEAEATKARAEEERQRIEADRNRPAQAVKDAVKNLKEVDKALEEAEKEFKDS